MCRASLTLVLALAGTPVLGVSLLGPDGTTYQLRDHLANTGPHLTLEIVAPDGTASVEAIPGTEGLDEERNPALVFDDQSGSLFAVWEQRVYGVFSQLLLAERTEAGTWRDPIELSGNPFATRADLFVSVDAGRPGIVPAGGTTPTRRQLLSLLWTEEAGPGYRVMYSPVALVDGAYVGANAILPLSSFGIALSPETVELISKPALAKAAEAETVAVAFYDPETDTYRRLLIRAVPVALSDFADKARAVIIELGAHTSPTARPEFADKARAVIIELGSRLHPSLHSYAAEAAKQALLVADEEDLYELADKARAVIIELGARALDPSPGREGTFVAAPLGTQFGADLELVWLDPLPRPPVPPGAVLDASLVSPTGDMAVLVWNLDGAEYFVESRGGEWSPVTPLPVDRLGLEGSLDLVRERLARH